jgi:hypothetical protein
VQEGVWGLCNSNRLARSSPTLEGKHQTFIPFFVCFFCFVLKGGDKEKEGVQEWKDEKKRGETQ